MDKLLEFIGNILKAIFAPKVIWLVVVTLAIFAWAIAF